MNLRRTKWIPAGIATAVVLLVCGMQILPVFMPKFDLIQRLESMSFDARVRLALRARHLIRPPLATNLAAIFIDEETQSELQRGSLGKSSSLFRRLTWPFPRAVHGCLLRELQYQGAHTVALDILFDQPRANDPPVAVPRSLAAQWGFTPSELDALPSYPHEIVTLDRVRTNVPGVIIESDAFFSRFIQQGSNVVLAALPEVIPHDSFRTNAWAIGDITGLRPESDEMDSDGVLRRLRAYTDYRLWHPEIYHFALQHGLDLNQARIQNNQVWFPNPVPGEPRLQFPLAPGTRVYTEQRVWQLGLVMGARALGLDLDRAEVRPGRIVLRGTNGLRRIIPVDSGGRFLVDWNLAWNDPRIVTLSYGALLWLDELRHNPQYTPADRAAYLESLRANTGRISGDKDAPMRHKLVVVGSILKGNNMADLGPTPLSKQTYLTSSHWNVANALLTGRFVRACPYLVETALIIFLGAVAAFLNWKLRALWASLWILAVMLAYVLLGVGVYLLARFWLPMTLPLLGSLLATHVCTVTYLAIFEQQERRRIKSLFVRLVSPEVVNELLGAEKLSLGGARRQVTVLFADVRGFTEFTDQSHAKAEEYARRQQLSEADAESLFDQQAQEVLRTVNVYLGAVADVTKKHQGTLDKYIGDCVMAFWGAPIPNEKHALCCVRAAVEAQRAIHEINGQRSAENQRRERDNASRMANGQPPLPLLPLLTLGTGINSGIAIVGLMGSDAHGLNYTVFGREVNLASRLEGVSGRSRIIISEGTHFALQRDDPALAATCHSLPPVFVKGFREAIRIYEVPWQSAELVPSGVPAPPPVKP